MMHKARKDALLQPFRCPLPLRVVAFFLLCSCSGGSSFTGPSKDRKDKAPQAANAAPKTDAQTKTERFSTSTIESNVDLLWIIDNSGSMVEESDSVNQNFREFHASLSSKIGMNVAVISQLCKGNDRLCIERGNLYQNKIQFLPIPVGSNNALAILAAASCSASLSNISSRLSLADQGRICGVALKELMETPWAIIEAFGKLASFFRTDARKVIVVVTDDDAMGFLASDFLAAMAQTNAADFTLFGFVSLSEDESNPACQGLRGNEYISLAERTKGEVFDICDRNWSTNFSKLSNGVRKLASTRFSLQAQAVKALVKVNVDGRSLMSHQYKLDGTTVEIMDRTVITGESQTIEISYQ